MSNVTFVAEWMNTVNTNKSNTPKHITIFTPYSYQYVL